MKRTITPLLSLIIALIVFTFVTKPKYDEILVVQKQVAEFNDATQKFSDYNARIQGLILKKDSISVKDKNRLDALVSEKLDGNRILVDLETMALKSNLFLVSVMGSNKVTGTSVNGSGFEGSLDETASEEIQFADIGISLTGSYDDFKTFLRMVEQSIVLMDVVNLKITSKGYGLSQFDMSIRTYALPKQ